jgi:phage-related baseplate assembly protein
MRQLIDLSKLPPPQLIEELDYERILVEMRSKLRDILPEWTGWELESDPANKVLEVAAYREMLLRQRINEAARGVMVAFAGGSDLDHLAAFYPESRLPGSAATFRAKLSLSATLQSAVTIPQGFRLVAKEGQMESRLMLPVVIEAGTTEGEGLFEVIRPDGMKGNGISTGWNAVTPMPFVVGTQQLEPSHGGSDVESDVDFRRRIPMALERYSTAGPRGAYEYWAYTADARVRDVRAKSPEPGDVKVVLLSSEGNGTADSAMILRVTELLNKDTVRPLTDRVSVVSARLVEYRVKVVLVLYSGVSGVEPFREAKRQIETKVEELRRVGTDIPRSALVAAAHVSGVKEVHLVEPATDIRVSDEEAGWCTSIEVDSVVADEP